MTQIRSPRPAHISVRNAIGIDEPLWQSLLGRARYFTEQGMAERALVLLGLLSALETRVLAATEEPAYTAKHAD